jgi:phosphorylase kinase gamma subunit/serine/threonine-protein kinase Chk2/calcium/calmodulin-dependent protein kinase I
LKVTDFGLAKHANNNALKTFCGTPQYFAPEVLGRRQEGAHHRTNGYGYKADMWSIGVVLFIMLSGTFPFDEENLYDQVLHVILDISNIDTLQLLS